MRSLKTQPPFSDVSSLRLRTIIRLRWVAVIGQAAAVLGVYYGLGFELPIKISLLIIALSAALNIYLRLYYPATLRLQNPYAFFLLSYDLLQLSLLLYLTGGLENPFVFLLVVPVIVSASTQPAHVTLLLGLIAMSFATILLFYAYPLPWDASQPLVLPHLFKIGTWTAVVSGIVFTGLYAQRISKEAQQMSDALTATEMVLAREQKLQALDGLAAAAAHELGTPLSTISVIAKELERDLPKDTPHYDDVLLLRAQANRCREILTRLTDHDGETDVMFAQVPVMHLLQEVIEEHSVFDKSVTVEAKPVEGLYEPLLDQPLMVRNPGIIYGLGNIVENAVDFAQGEVNIMARWSETEVFLRICDDGPGFAPSIREHLGDPYVTTRSKTYDVASKHEGMGLGYFIAKTLLERTGAKLTFYNRTTPEVGAVVEVVWQRGDIDVGMHKVIQNPVFP